MKPKELQWRELSNNCIGAVSDYGTYLLNKADNEMRFSSFSPDVLNKAESLEAAKSMAEALNDKHWKLIGLAVTYEQSGD